MLVLLYQYIYHQVILLRLLQNQIPGSVEEFLQGIGKNLGSQGVSVILALGIVILSWIIATVVAAFSKSFTKNIVTYIRSRVSNQTLDSLDNAGIENWISFCIFWIIFGLGLIGFFEVFGLRQFSRPLNKVLGNIFAYLPSIFAAAIVLFFAWLLATLVRLAINRSLNAIGWDEKISSQVQDSSDSDSINSDSSNSNSINTSNVISRIIYWLIIITFVPSVLNILGLERSLQPLQLMIAEISSFIPNIIAAGLLIAVGWFAARIVRTIITNFLHSIGVDRFGSRLGIGNQNTENQTTGKSLSWLLGSVVWIFILIVSAISAFNKLGIDSISEPMISLLNQIFTSLPQIIVALIIVSLGYFIAKFIASFLNQILSDIGFNNLLSWLGFSQMSESHSVQINPSTIVSSIIQIGIILISVLMAVDILNLATVAVITQNIVVILTRILFGLSVLAIGLYFAKLSFDLILSSHNNQSRILAYTARTAIAFFTVAVSLEQMGVAENIIQLAFGLSLGAFTISIGIATGIGGRYIAKDLIREWLGR